MTDDELDAPLPFVLIAGGIGGGVADFALHGVDTIKTRLQGQSGLTPKYANAAHAMFTIMREEGPRGLYSGAFAALSGSVPSNMIYFWSYEMSKRALLPYLPEGLTFFVSGAIGEFCGAVFYVPSEVIKTRMQLQGIQTLATTKYKYISLKHAVTSIYREEGFMTFFEGFRATMYRDMPASAVQFAVYEHCKSFFLHRNARKKETGPELSLFENIISGGTASGAAGLFTTPLDVVKTQLQTRTSEGIYQSVWGGIRSVYRMEGLRGLFRGAGPRVLWSIPQGSIMFLVYEQVVSLLNRLVEN